MWRIQHPPSSHHPFQRFFPCMHKTLIPSPLSSCAFQALIFSPCYWELVWFSSNVLIPETAAGMMGRLGVDLILVLALLFV